MTWLLFALLNPILHAGTNHFDKHLISKYFKDLKVGALVIFSGLISVIMLPIVLFFAHGTFNISFGNGIILALNGTLIILAVMFYLSALNLDEASFVVPFFQFIPVLGLILSFIFLGETIQFQKIIGAFIILAGGAILSLDLTNRKIKFKKKVVFFMLLSSLCYAVNIIIFKSIAIGNGFWQSLFWDLIGKIIFSVCLFTFIAAYRKSFLSVLQTYKIKFVLLAGLNEIMMLVGDWSLSFASLLAPVFLVQTVSATQPIFVFIFGIALTKFFPKLGTEILDKKLLAQKLTGIIVVIAGALLFL